MFGLFLALLMFADDIVLMAPTRLALNKLIKTCSEYCTEFGLSFNSKKSKVMLFSKSRIDHESLAPVMLKGIALSTIKVSPFHAKMTSSNSIGRRIRY